VSHLFEDTFFELAVVENFAFAAIDTTLDAFGCTSQHRVKFRQFQNNSCVFYGVRTTSGVGGIPIDDLTVAPCAVVPNSYSGTVIKQLSSTLD